MTQHTSGPYRVSWRTALIGVTVIAGLLIAPLTAPLAVSGASAKSVEMLADSFDPKSFTVEVGTILVFKNTSALPHTATADNGAFDTGMISAGGSKPIPMSKPGTFAFHCQFHGGPGGVGQSGTITVKAAAAVTPAPTKKAGSVAAPTGGSQADPTAPSSAMLPDLPGGAPGLPVLAFTIAGLGSVVVALFLGSIRGAGRRRPGR
jgi:plastocyanin